VSSDPPRSTAGGAVGLAAAAQKLKHRENWIGWNPTQQSERLKLVVQNRRYLLLHAKGKEPARKTNAKRLVE